VLNPVKQDPVKILYATPVCVILGTKYILSILLHSDITAGKSVLTHHLMDINLPQGINS
jgi:hypothetical protein